MLNKIDQGLLVDLLIMASQSDDATTTSCLYYLELINKVKALEVEPLDPVSDEEMDHILNELSIN